VGFLLRILKKRHTARRGTVWFAMARVWQSHCQRDSADDGHASHANCDYARSSIPQRTGGGRFRCVHQHDVLGHNDRGFHRLDTLDKRAEVRTSQFASQLN
jgi:hypothetical protein